MAKTKKVKKVGTKIKKKKEKSAGKIGVRCGFCVFFVANKEKLNYGSCFQVSGEVQEKQAPKCGGKFFKKKEADIEMIQQVQQ